MKKLRATFPLNSISYRSRKNINFNINPTFFFDTKKVNQKKPFVATKFIVTKNSLKKC